ncbi:putative DD41D transposase [Trichonephila clavipes]|nr:putative DD41D transposase [Trichonephila clavipes]
MVDFHKRILFSDEAHFWLNGYVNKQNCRANPQVVTVTNFFIPELNNYDVQELWFQQDGATCHTAHATIDLLKDTFGDHLISRFGPVNWPPRSCDLTPLDYFLWGYVKSLVYADKPQTLDHLKDNIRRVIADIRPQMLEKVIENWTSRLDYIRASRGNPMPEIIFKIYLDGNRCRRFSGFQMLNYDEITTSVQTESDPVDDETDEDEDNNKSSKGPSNTGVFSALEIAMEWYEQ